MKPIPVWLRVLCVNKQFDRAGISCPQLYICIFLFEIMILTSFYNKTCCVRTLYIYFSVCLFYRQTALTERQKHIISSTSSFSPDWETGTPAAEWAGTNLFQMYAYFLFYFEDFSHVSYFALHFLLQLILTLLYLVHVRPLFQLSVFPACGLHPLFFLVCYSFSLTFSFCFCFFVSYKFFLCLDSALCY